MNQAVSFLRRWSRLKRDASVPAPASAPVRQPDAAGEAVASESEFGAFLDPEVTRDVRQAALRTLFMTDHYRTMDGLDVYVDDYSKPELLTADMLDKLDHARDLLTRNEPRNEHVVEQNRGSQGSEVAQETSAQEKSHD